MHIRRLRLFIILLLAGLTANQPLLASANIDPLIVGVFPRRNFKQTIKMFTPLVEHLSRQLGRSVRLESARNFGEFWKGVSSKHYDIVHYNQYHYVKSHKEFGYQVILKNEEFGNSKLSGALVVRKDSGITALTDLKGKKIVFGGGRSAMMSYIVPTSLLLDAGLHENDYTARFSKNPPNALMTTYIGHADACGVGDVVIRLPFLVKRIDTGKLILLAKSKPIAHLPWAVKQGMPSALRNRIQAIFINLKNSETGRKILKHAKLTNILAATDDEYDIHRRIIQRVTGESF